LTQYITRRLFQLIPVLIGISVIVFFLLRLIPGDPADIMLGERGTAEMREQIQEVLGLNRPIYEQYFIFSASPLRMSSRSAGRARCSCLCMVSS